MYPLLLVATFFCVCWARTTHYNCLIPGDVIQVGDCFYSDDIQHKACLFDDGRFCIIPFTFDSNQYLTFDPSRESNIPDEACMMTEQELYLSKLTDRIAKRLYMNVTSRDIIVENQYNQIIWKSKFMANYMTVSESSFVFKSTDNSRQSLECQRLSNPIYKTLRMLEFQSAYDADREWSSGFYSSLPAQVEVVLDAPTSSNNISDQSYIRTITISMDPQNTCYAGNYKWSSNKLKWIHYFDQVYIGTGCLECKIGYYRSDGDPVDTCLPCPAGQSTATAGSSSSNACYGVLPSTIMGFWVLCVFLFVWYVYFVRGRLFRLASRCKYLVSRLAMKNCEITLIMLSYALLGTTMVKTIDDQKASDNNGSSINYEKNIPRPSWCPWFPLSIASAWWLIHAKRVLYSLIFIVVLFVGFFLAICGLLVNAMIMIKASSFGNIFVTFSVFSDFLFGFLKTIFRSNWFQVLLYPFLVIVNALSNINLPLDSVQVTCDGPAMLSRLTIDLIIISAVLVYIWSDIAIYWNVALRRCLNRFYSLLTNKTFVRTRRYRLLFDLAVSCFAWYLPDPTRVVLYVFSFFSNPYQTSSNFMRCGSIDSAGLEIVLSLLIICSLPIFYTVGCMLVPSFRLFSRVTHRRLARMPIHEREKQKLYCKKESQMRIRKKHRMEEERKRLSSLLQRQPYDSHSASEFLPWSYCWAICSHHFEQINSYIERCFEYNLSYLISGQYTLQCYMDEVTKYFKQLTLVHGTELPGLKKLTDTAEFLQRDLSDTHVIGFSWKKLFFPVTITSSFPSHIVEEELLFYERERILHSTYPDLVYAVYEDLVTYYMEQWQVFMMKDHHDNIYDWLLWSPLQGVVLFFTTIPLIYMTCSNVGKEYSFIMLRNFFHFALACFGIWTRNMMDTFELNFTFRRIKDTVIRFPTRIEMMKIRKDLKMLMILDDDKVTISNRQRSCGQSSCIKKLSDFNRCFSPQFKCSEKQLSTTGNYTVTHNVKVEYKKFNFHSAMKFHHNHQHFAAKALLRNHRKRILKPHRDVENGDIDKVIKDNDESFQDKEEYLQMMASIVAVRVVLLQIIPYVGGFLSVFLADLAISPLFIFRKKLRDKVPPLILLNPIAHAKQSIGLVNMDSRVTMTEDWFLWLRVMIAAAHEFITQSRLIVFCYSLLKNFVILIVLLYNPSTSNVDDTVTDDSQKSMRFPMVSKSFAQVMTSILFIVIVIKVSISSLHFTLTMLDVLAHDQTEAICKKFNISAEELRAFSVDADLTTVISGDINDSSSNASLSDSESISLGASTQSISMKTVEQVTSIVENDQSDNNTGQDIDFDIVHRQPSQQFFSVNLNLYLVPSIVIQDQPYSHLVDSNHIVVDDEVEDDIIVDV